MSMNIFRLCGDTSRLLSIFILFRRLHTSRNAQGISLKTQELYLIVVLARYTDLFTIYYSFYNTVMKIIFIAAQCCVIYLLRWNGRISASYDKDTDTFPHFMCAILPCGIIALMAHLIYGNSFITGDGFSLFYSIQELLWIFSIILESIAILPQLMLLRKYRRIENLTGNYVFFMGLYRFLYIFNWIYRSNYEPGYRHHYGVYFCGVLQTLLYIDFFHQWVISKIRGRELKYGEDGDMEYERDVNELRNYDNSLSLIENGDTDADLRMRGSNSTAASSEDTTATLLVV